MTDSRTAMLGHRLDQPAQQHLPVPSLAAVRTGDRVHDLDHRAVVTAQHSFELGAVRGAPAKVLRAPRSASGSMATADRAGWDWNGCSIRGGDRRRIRGAASDGSSPSSRSPQFASRRSDQRSSRSAPRRSPGPLARDQPARSRTRPGTACPDRRGTASRVTVTRISRRAGRVPRVTTRAAAAACAEEETEGQNGQLARGHGRPDPRCPAPLGAPSLFARVAARHGGRQPNSRLRCMARRAGGRLTHAGSVPGTPAPVDRAPLATPIATDRTRGPAAP